MNLLRIYFPACPPSKIFKGKKWIKGHYFLLILPYPPPTWLIIIVNTDLKGNNRGETVAVSSTSARSCSRGDLTCELTRDLTLDFTRDLTKWFSGEASKRLSASLGICWFQPDRARTFHPGSSFCQDSLRRERSEFSGNLSPMYT